MAHTELDLRERRAVEDILTGYHGVTAQRMSDARRGEDGPDARSVRRMRP
ncbi:hypothetical protein ACVDG3_20885 [Meridianimarinicoccus sp. RP-17]|nr:hypothetical protein [Phycocomes zhengii]